MATTKNWSKTPRDLRDARDDVGGDADFHNRLALLREANQRPVGLIHRLDTHGLR